MTLTAMIQFIHSMHSIHSIDSSGLRFIKPSSFENWLMVPRSFIVTLHVTLVRRAMREIRTISVEMEILKMRQVTPASMDREIYHWGNFPCLLGGVVPTSNIIWKMGNGKSK